MPRRGGDLAPAYERLREHVLSQPVIEVDETHWKLMGEKGKKKGGKGKRWQAWAICCPDAVHYSFEDSYSAKTASAILGGYNGVVLTDGYASYESVKKGGGRFSRRRSSRRSVARRSLCRTKSLEDGRSTRRSDL